MVGLQHDSVVSWDGFVGSLLGENIRAMMSSSPMDIQGKSPHNESAFSTSPPCESFVDCALSPQNFTNHMAAALMPAKNEPPMDLLPGELMEESAQFLASKVFLTNYRLIILHDRSRAQNVPGVESIALVNIDTVDSVGSDALQISCKEARVVRLCASSTEQACSWYKKLAMLAVARPPQSLFALSIGRMMRGRGGEEWCRKEAEPEWEFDEKAMFDRMKIDPDYFSVVDFNKEYTICSTYPRNLIIPKEMEMKDIESLRDYRMLGRIPAVAWHCPKRHTLLLRASQPRVSVFAWRNDKDEKFLRLVTEYTAKKRGTENSGHLKIYDCRSYTAALGNRMKGGGSEREEHYTNMTLEFCNLPNIHNVRYYFVNLRTLFNPPVDQATFLSSLQATQWLSNIMNILQFANKAAEQLVDKGVNVLIHCSDGWDRTTQLVALVKILVDPYFRTMRGIEELIRRDWIGYGHKFSDRNGISGTDQNERCPVFLQWLDAVHQILHKHPNEFEYSMAYLVKLAAHVSSGLFTSFCFNSVQEMERVCTAEGVEEGFTIWRMLNADPAYENALFYPEIGQSDDRRTRIVAPENMQGMRLWNEVYRCHEVESLLSTKNGEEERREDARGTQTPSGTMDRSGEWKEGMERSLVKSRSSESIASTSESQVFPSTPSQHRLSESVESEVELRDRRQTRTSLSNGSTGSGGSNGEETTPPPQTAVERERGAASGYSSPQASASPQSVGTPDMKTVLDCDGLVRFVDKTQESARKLTRQRDEEMRRKKEEKTSRARMRSEMSDLSRGGGDDEPFQMDDLLSDASMIDEGEMMNTPRNHGLQVHASHCSLCRKAFSMMMWGTAKAKVNCDSCGRAMCASCCAHSYNEPVDGKSRSRRACTECYGKMYAAPPPGEMPREIGHDASSLTSSLASSLSSPSPLGSPQGRSCPDGETHPEYMSKSQVVQG